MDGIREGASWNVTRLSVSHGGIDEMADEFGGRPLAKEIDQHGFHDREQVAAVAGHREQPAGGQRTQKGARA